MKKLPIIIIIVFAVALIGILLFVDTYQEEQTTETTTQNIENIETQPDAASIDSEDITDEDLTEQQLLYLIEEEKLAHDVYTVFYEKYGVKVFGNILESETTHQERVLTLLKAWNISDPRTSEIGVFTNSDLQKFYDDLIAQGIQSETDAIKAAIIIEETDIADIKKQISITTDEDVKSTLEDLLRGSENHLRAFTRQVNG